MNSSNLLANFLVILFSSIVVARSSGDGAATPLFPTSLPDPTQQPQVAGPSGTDSSGSGTAGSDPTTATTPAPVLTTTLSKYLDDGRLRRAYCPGGKFDKSGFCIGHAYCQFWSQIPYVDFRLFRRRLKAKPVLEGTKYFLNNHHVFTYEHGAVVDKCMAHITQDGWSEDATIRCSSLGFSDLGMSRQSYNDECQTDHFSWETFADYYEEPKSWKRFD